MFNFDFIEKGVAIVFPPHFVYDFSREIEERLLMFSKVVDTKPL